MLAISTMAYSQAVLSSCEPPMEVTINQITPSSVALNWCPAGRTTNWVVEVGATNFIPGRGQQTNLYYQSISRKTPVVSKNLMSLNHDTYYDLYIKTDCDDNGTSQWIGPFSFKTESLAVITP